jgi:Na+/H+-translocating membrane pyrophosphatase
MLCVIAVAIFLSVLIYAGTPPMFIAYGVAMTGIGMLTLTGNTISMDVFGPVADNANGIGEMGYDKDEMEKPSPAATSGPGRSWPTSTRWATPPRPRPRASPSVRP